MTVTQRIATWSLTLLLAACGGGYEGTAPPIDTSTQPLKVVGATSITLVPTEMGRIEITGGTRPYTVTSSNAAVALASVSDNILSVAAVRGDLTPITVSVTDAKNAKTALSVTVTNSPQQGSFALSERVFSILPGASKTVTISGGTGPYTAASITPLVASVSVNGNTLTVTGRSEGANAEIKVFDSKGVTQSALVTVSAPIPSASGLALFTNMPTNLSLRPKNSVTYTLGGGTPPYSVTSSNTAVLSGEVRGAALILQPGVAGNATVTVTDSASGTLNQRIFVMTTSAPLMLSATSVTGEVGSTLTLGIAGGMPPYTATTTATTLIGSGFVVNGDQLSINFQFADGPGVIAVKDSEGSIATVDVTGVPLLSSLSVSPTAVTVPESAVTTLPIRLMRGKAPYLVFSSHPTLLRPTVSGNVMTVTSPTLPCVSANTPVTITVIDATSASATTTVTIQDNGACP
ncbi:MAG: hypothetical protein K2W33_02925 [Burkholderiales bacterium]|nr:hypothetical protein [Burkholderiales bacterium]